MSVATQKSKILLDEEYYTYTQPPPAQPQQPQQPPPPPQQPSQPSVEDYIASTEHLFESQAPSPVSEFSIVKTGAGNIYVYTSAGWQKLEYRPDSNTYSLTPVSLPDITVEVQRLGGVGYKLDPQLAEKLAEQEPGTLMFYGVEYALRYARLKELFPELRGKELITEADVWNVVRERLEKYGWSVRSEEDFERHAALARAVFENPDVWKTVEADIQMQLAEHQRKQEELSSFYTAKALKQWDAEREAAIRRQIEERYKFFESTPTSTLFISGVGRGFISGITLGLLPKEWLPKDTGHFYESLFERYRQLSLKPLEEPLEKAGLRPVLDLARFWATLVGSPLAPILSHPDVWAPVAREYLVGEEKIELEALQRVLTPERRLAYGLGYGLGSAVGLGALNVVASKTIEPAAQRALGKLAQHAAEHPESNLAKIAEKTGLVRREQLVPKEVESIMIREAGGQGRILIAKTKITEWGKAEEVLGKKVPESMRLGEREITVLPLEGGAKVPFASEGEFFVIGSEKLVYTKEGLKLKDPFALYVKSTGEESFLAARLTSEQAVIPPRVDVLAVRARVDYAKVLEQVQGGLPRAVLLEEGDILAGISRTPKISVKEVFTPGKVPSIQPILLPTLLVEEEERRVPEAPSIPLKIPGVEHVKLPDISAKPLLIPSSSVKPFQAFKPEVTEVTVPKLGELPLQLPRVESKAAEVTAPKLALPKVQLPQLPRLEPKLEPRAEPKVAQRAEPQLPKLPSPIGVGTRDLPITRSFKMLSRKMWVEEWFGDIVLSGGKRTKKGGGKGRRGGRR